MTTGGKDRGTRESRERARIYQARQQLHEKQVRRRTRDNLIAGIAGGLLVVGILVLQTVYFVAGPGAPAPAPTSGVTPSPSPTMTDVPAETPQPTPEPSPSATE